MKQGKKYTPTDEDREFVRRCIVSGMTVDETATAINLSDETLRKYYRFEIITGRAILNGNAVKVLEDALKDGSVDAAKFILSRRAGWTEKTSHEVSGKDGGPLVTTIKIIAADDGD